MEKRKRFEKYGLIYFETSTFLQKNINNDLDKHIIFDAMKPLLKKKEVSLLLNDLFFDKMIHSNMKDINNVIHPNRNVPVDSDGEDVALSIDGEFEDNNSLSSAVNEFNPHALNELYAEFIKLQCHIWPIDNGLRKEIELLNIQMKHKFSIKAFGTIMSWSNNNDHVKSPMEKGISKSRDRETIMRDLGKRLKMKSFEETYLPKIVEWLPDKRPTTIYVKNAVDAIFLCYQIRK